MRTVVAYPGGGAFAQEVALAFQEVGALEAFVTTLAHLPSGGLERGLAALPGRAPRRLLAELRRRSVHLAPERVRTQPFWEIVRIAAARAGANPVLVDMIWDRLSHAFDGMVARRWVPRVEAVYAYEYTALATFERARTLGVKTLLDLPSLNSRAYEALQRNERERFPELRGRHDRYFENRFEARQARRDREVELADVIVTNSTLNMRSHVEAGADASKFVVVPLAAPAAIDEVRSPFDPGRPLAVIWAGAFSLRKGAHLFLDAIEAMGARSAMTVDVYGGVQLPAGAVAAAPDSVRFHGSVPQARLFEAFEAADVLVFPTLSDGFGLVVGEAFAHGLPVITTDQAGAADLVRRKGGGLIVPAGDAARLAEALTWCLDERETLYGMRELALATAKAWQWPDYRRTLMDQLRPRIEGRPG